MLRRGFFAGLAALLAALTAGVIAFLWPGHTRRLRADYDAGAADAFAVGDVRHFQVDRGTEARDFHLVRRPDGFVAFWHRCTHVGCAVPFRPELELPNIAPGVKGLFRCPCHGSTFSKEEGERVFGPATRPLDALPVRIEKGRVVVTIREGAERRRADHEPAPLAVWPQPFVYAPDALAASRARPTAAVRSCRSPGAHLPTLSNTTVRARAA